MVGEDPKGMDSQMLNIVSKDAPHMDGQAFLAVITACLIFEEVAKGYDELLASRASVPNYSVPSGSSTLGQLLLEPHTQTPQETSLIPLWLVLT